MKIFKTAPNVSRFVSVLVLVCLIAVTGCVEEVIDQNEVNSARLIASNALKKPKLFNITYTSINENSVSKISDGWCKDDKFTLTNTFNGKRTYYFHVECKPTEAFVIRIEMKSPTTLIYVEPYIAKPPVLKPPK